MSQYRTGSFTSTGAAVTLPLGFIPDKVNVYNLTVLEVNPPNDASPAQSFWIKGMPSPSAVQTIYTAGVPAVSYATTNGISTVDLGADWQSTQYVITGITKANPGVVTVSSISPTNTLTLVNGMIVTISGVLGMTQVNTNRYVVANISGSTFQLYDLFGNPVDTSGFGTFAMTNPNAMANQISYPATAPTIGPNGQIIAQGNPPGNQYDIGYMGIILGTALVGDSTDSIWWEAITATPTGW
jgi:hypothetical protein